MHIEKIIDVDGEKQSWDVLISDNKNKILCFSSEEINGSQNIKLVCCFADKIVKSDVKQFLIKKQGISCYEYKITAKLVNKKENKFSVFGFLFELDELLPEDITDGDFIDFVCLRMDCIAD